MKLIGKFLITGGFLILGACDGGSRDRGRSGPAAAADAYQQSLAPAQQALARHPRHPRLLQVLGAIHHRRGKFREALECYRQARREDPEAAEPLFSLAEVHLQLGENAEAMEAYRQALPLLPANEKGRALFGLGQACFNAGQFGEAASHLRAALGAGAGGAEVHYQLGKALDAHSRGLKSIPGHEKESEQAALEGIQALEAAVAQSPAHAQAHFLLGGMYQRRNQMVRARQELETFRRVKPPSEALKEEETARAEVTFLARSLVQIAGALIDLGDHGEALALAREAVRADGSFVEARVLEGRALLKLERFDEAQQAYQQALDRDRDQAESLWNIGKIHLRRNRVQEAAPLLLKAVEIRKTFAEGWELLVELSQEHSLFADRAEEFATKALGLRPSPKNYSNLAMVCFSQGNAEKSRQVLLEGLKRYPHEPELEEGLRALQQTLKR
ncbi:MAG: tetratricopeptide repeat protein [Planctomycetes bacterium]|nr:tetratricopeptide repeat protein [Planctomycetota bacterium]